MKNLKKTMYTAGLAALLAMPFTATKAEAQAPEPASCNGQLGSSRQAQIQYDGINPGSGMHMYRVTLDCLQEPTVWSFLDFYEPDGVTYLGTFSSTGNGVGFMFDPDEELDFFLVIKAYDSFDPATQTYGNLLGEDELTRFRNLHAPGLASDEDGGDKPATHGWVSLDDWFGQENWPDFADTTTVMVENYLVGPSHVQDRVRCEKIYVNGVPYTGGGSNYPAECSNLFRDGFESGDLDAWSFHTE